MSAGNKFVTIPSNPSRRGGSVGSTDSSLCTTVDIILANATSTNRAPKDVKVAAGMIRSGGGAEVAPAKRTSEISRENETEEAVHHHTHRQTSDSRTPNLALASDSGGGWPICKGTNRAAGGDKLPGTSVRLTPGRASVKGVPSLGGRRVIHEQPVIRLAIVVVMVRMTPVRNEGPVRRHREGLAILISSRHGARYLILDGGPRCLAAAAVAAVAFAARQHRATRHHVAVSNRRNVVVNAAVAPGSVAQPTGT